MKHLKLRSQSNMKMFLTNWKVEVLANPVRFQNLTGL
jgi:hypothetical protein